MLTVDGAQGEGGGQILRTALALSLCVNQPFRMINIRARRRRPGLQYQHLAAVHAAAQVSAADVSGATKDSLQLTFKPGRVVAGDYRIDIGTAGSTTLVLQTILPALMLAESYSTVIIEGGTHNPMAPPFEFMQYALLPLLHRMGAGIRLELLRPGFAPAGGGLIKAGIDPTVALRPLNIDKRGRILQRRAEVLLANLPEHIAKRELAVIVRLMSLSDEDVHYKVDTRAAGPGNVVLIMIQSAELTECFSEFGKKGLPAERVAQRAVQTAKDYLQADVPIGRYLADQLLVFLALAGGGRFVTMRPSLHTLTTIAVIKSFISIAIEQYQISDTSWQISFDH